MKTLRRPFVLICLFAASTGCTSSGHAKPGSSSGVRSLLGKPLPILPDGPERTKQEGLLAQARADLAANPSDPDKLIWVGRRLGYLWRIDEAIDTYSEGIRKHPDYAPLYRHRGHRYITARRFDKAIADLERAARLIAGKPDVIEPDGQPNARNIPLTSLGFNVYYHLALAHYLKGDFDEALPYWRKTLGYTQGYDDNIVAVLDWMYMTTRRMGASPEQSAALLKNVRPDMEIIENHAYHRRLLMYKGLVKPEELLGEQASDVDVATYGYGVGNWYLYNGDSAKARSVFERVVAGESWPAFGFVAAEAELARMR